PHRSSNRRGSAGSRGSPSTADRSRWSAADGATSSPLPERRREFARVFFTRGVADGRGIPPQPSVDDLDGEHRLGDHALERVIPAAPAVKDAALDKERVGEGCDRRRPAEKAKSVGSAEGFARGGQQVVG